MMQSLRGGMTNSKRRSDGFSEEAEREAAIAAAGERVIDAVRAMRKSRDHTSLQRVIYMLDEHQLTPVQVDILETVAAGSAMRMSEVAATLGVDASTLTRTLAPLIEYGLLRRSVAPNDRRVVIVEATAVGIEGARRIGATRREVMRAVLGRMAPERIHLLADLMEEYLRSVAHEARARGVL